MKEGASANLAFRSPLPVGCRDAYGAVSVDGDAEDGVDRAETGGVVER